MKICKIFKSFQIYRNFLNKLIYVKIADTQFLFFFRRYKDDFVHVRQQSVLLVFRLFNEI